MKHLACALVGLVCSLASAQSGAPAASDTTAPREQARNSADFVLLSGEFDRVSSTSGGAGSADWVHQTEGGRTTSLGITSYSLMGSSWTLGRGGMGFHPHDRILLAGDVSVGPGRAGNSHFTYVALNSSVSFKAWKRLYPKLQDEYLNIGPAAGNLLKTGVLLIPVRALSFDSTYARSVGGNLNSQYVSERAEFNHRDWRFLAGGSLGRSTPGVVNIAVGSGGPSGNLREAFLGTGVTVFKCEMTAVVDFLNLGAVRRRTVTLNFKLPIHRQ